MSTFRRLEFNVETTSTNSVQPPLTLQISDPGNISADNLALATWGSSQILADILHRLDFLSAVATTSSPHDNPSPSSRIPVLELGAGTGLVGLAAAAIWKTSSILTDLEPILPAINANIELNEDLVRTTGGAARCGTLDWEKPTELRLWSSGLSESALDNEVLSASVNKARVILAADTVYSEGHPELLTQTVEAWLEPGQDSRLVICYPLRIGYIDHIRDLWERLENAGLETVEEGREHLDATWDEDVPYEWSVWRWKSQH